MSTHNIGFYEEISKIIFELSSNIIKYAPYFFCCFTIWGLYKEINHYDYRPKQFNANSNGCRSDNFQLKFSFLFLIFAQNIDCGYTLERVHSIYVSEQNNVYPCKPQFYYIKVGFKGVCITWTC